MNNFQSNLFSKINLKLIVIHLFAGWFIMAGFYTFSYLTNIQLAERFKSFTPFTGSAWWGNSNSDFALTLTFAGLAGLFVSCIISLAICLHKKWYWINAGIVIMLSIFLFKFYWEIWNITKPVAWFAGDKIENIVLGFLINGLILLSIGIILFFSKFTNQFIQMKSMK